MNTSSAISAITSDVAEFRLTELEERLEMTAMSAATESRYCCECVGRPMCDSET
ncbi:hypothetical protein [Tahibacter amnicola]|uniref:Uncharacterized protein n=1 Tax=Tahibacter amnicola TaxID=2976241 RepID=A0ABY6BR96_9GAMM|nr:hypothetical protein [Tahibacter amnicola]UXI70287.1 hypothetical protein N4264_11820 [Tahibacter amnicola]